MQAIVDSDWSQASFEELPAVASSLGWHRISEEHLEEIYAAASGLALELSEDCDGLQKATSLHSFLKHGPVKEVALFAGGYARACADVAAALLESIHDSKRQRRRQSKRATAREVAMEMATTCETFRPRDVLEACTQQGDMDAPTVSRALSDLVEAGLLRRTTAPDDVVDQRGSFFSAVGSSKEAT